MSNSVFNIDALQKQLAEVLNQAEKFVVEDDVKAAAKMMLFMRMKELKREEAISELELIYKLTNEQANLLLTELERDKRLKFKSSGFAINFNNFGGIQIHDPTRVLKINMNVAGMGKLKDALKT